MAIERPGIYALIGEIGVGKSHLACALVNALCRIGRSGKYMDASDYVAGVRGCWGQPGGAEERYVHHHVRGYSLLAFDEITMRRDSADENLILNRLLKKRGDERLTTLLIGNYADKAELGGSIDARVADRI